MRGGQGTCEQGVQTWVEERGAWCLPRGADLMPMLRWIQEAGFGREREFMFCFVDFAGLTLEGNCVYCY